MPVLAAVNRATREMHDLKDVTAQTQEIFAAPIARSVHIHLNDLFNPARPRSHDHDAIAHVNRFVDIMCDQEHGRAMGAPNAQDFILHPHPGKSIERAEWFVEQEHSGMIDHGSGKSDPLGHAAGKMMRECVGKCFQTYEAHELIDLMPLLSEDAACHEAGFNVPAHGEPRKKVGILKNQTALGIRFSD
jgi:hypothetical protein